MNVVVNGLMTYYEKFGKGKTIVLMHGWGDSLSTFNKLTNSLEKKYTVLALDLPGMGKTEPPTEAWGLAEYSDFVMDWLKKIGATKIHAFVGHSNGGSIAIQGIASKKLSAEKLVLISSAGIRSDKRIRRLALRLVAKSGKLVTAPLPAGTRKTIRGRFYKRVGSEITLLPHLEETFRKIVRQDVRSYAAQLQTPTLLIYGQNDRQTPVEYGKIYNRLIPKSKLEILPQTGHFPHHEHPAKVSNMIMEFM